MVGHFLRKSLFLGILSRFAVISQLLSDAENDISKELTTTFWIFTLFNVGMILLAKKVLITY